ncbi:hypothetical protein CEXT_673581 [Caerostris extrusa]|uniref:Uncharacterized protein n=1 Tax=Caerostris extrusa TaxID=172846 RepID=A0AAV4QA10_CAEEX|nr:hypothetical protein CEXT_673581 [Caerostris extrusa]
MEHVNLLISGITYYHLPHPLSPITALNIIPKLYSDSIPARQFLLHPFYWIKSISQIISFFPDSRSEFASQDPQGKDGVGELGEKKESFESFHLNNVFFRIRLRDSSFSLLPNKSSTENGWRGPSETGG